MPIYSIQGPDGNTYSIEGPPGATREQVIRAIQERMAKPAPSVVPPPIEPAKPEGGFFPAVKRGAMQMGMLLGDVAPAMAARAIGADEYADRQMREAAETQARIQREVPAAVPSYKDISGLGDAWTYAKEAVGETLASLVPTLLTGGAAGVLARPAIAAANVAAREAAEKALLASAMSAGPPTQVALKAAQEAAVKAGVDAAQKTALRYQVAGGFAGSAAQNVPEVYQNIAEETGKESIPAALVAGGFNAALDTILPAKILSSFRKTGIPDTELVGAWYKRAGKGLGKGFLIEGGTEAAQEASSVAAESYVAQNPEVFNSKNLERLINAGIKGGIGGGAITAATNIAAGQAPQPEVSDRQRAEQLQREILGDIEKSRLDQQLQEEEARKAAEAEANRPPSVQDLAGIASGPKGYTELELVKQRLLKQEKTPQVQEALDAIKDFQTRLTIEETQRKRDTISPTMDDKTIRSLGFVPGGENSVYAKLLGQDVGSPEVRAFLTDYAEKKAKPQTKERIEKFLTKVGSSQIPFVPGAADATKLVSAPSGKGVSVAGKPGAGAAAPGAKSAKPTGMVSLIEDVEEPAGGERVQPTPVEPTEIKGLSGSQTRIILPDGEKRPASWEVIEADSVSAALVEGKAQPRDRQRAVSNAQVKSIANNPDFDRLSDTSQTMDYGAPTLTGDYVIVGGNGRFEGINLSYDTEAGQAYKQNLVNNAQRLGLDPDQVSGMKKPVLIRKIAGESAKPDDTRKLAIQSNIVAGLEMSDMERAALDAERMTNLDQLDITDTGDIPLTTKNMGTVRDALKGYTKEELSGMLSAEGGLSQSGLRRLKNAVLYKAYGKTDTLSRLLESPDADLKNVGTALMRASGNMSRLMDGIRSNAIPADYDIISDLTGAVETLSALRAEGTKVQDFINQSDMFGDGISNEAKTILTFLDQNLRSAKSITEFLNDYARAAASIEGAGESLFGEVELPSKQETIERAAKRPEAERAAAKAQQTIFEQPAGAPAAEGAAKPEGEGRPPEGSQGEVAKPSLPEATKAKPVKLSKETEAKIEELGMILQRIMGKFGLRDVALRIEQDLKANGEYANRLIKLALDAESPVRDLRHESLHAMKELGFFSDAQWTALEKQARDKWVDKYLKSRNTTYEGQSMTRYDAYLRLYGGSESMVLEEAIADAFADFDATKAPPGLMQAILKRMRNLFRSIREAMGVANIDSAEDIFSRVEKGELKETAPAKAEGTPKPSLRTGPYAPPPSGFRRATQREKDSDNAQFVYDVGNGARLLFVPSQNGDVYVAAPGQRAEMVVRTGDNRDNVIKTVDQFPSYIPRNIRQAVLDYHKAVRGKTSDEEQTDIAMEMAEKIEKLTEVAPAAKLSLRTDTPEFTQWFGDSKVVDAQGKPKVMYHGTARDITAFKPKQAGAIFVTDKADFANMFAGSSAMWMTTHADQFLSKEQIQAGRQAAVKQIRKDYKADPVFANKLIDALDNPKSMYASDAALILAEQFKEQMPTGPNIMPVYVKADNPFDFENRNHIAQLEKYERENRYTDKTISNYMGFVERGSWEEIEAKRVQDAIKSLGFDGFYIKEGGVKNLAVYSPSQIKSAIGNVGAFGQRPVTKQEAERLGMTQEQAQEAQASGDIRFSLRDTAWTDKRIDSLVNQYGYTDGRTYGIAAYVNPDDFVAATTPTFEDAQKVREDAGALDKAKLAKETQTPFIEWDVERNAIIGHEGRHRMAALADSGITQAPVVLWVKDRFGGKKPDTYAPQAGISIAGQRFDTGTGDSLRAVNLVPLSYQYQKQLQEEFGGEAKVKFSLREEPVARQNLRSQLPASINQRVDQTTTSRDEKTFKERILDAISPKAFSAFRQNALNRYNYLSVIDKKKIELMGGADLLADASAESAALLSDLGAGITASAFGVHDRAGGAPVYKKTFVVEVNNRALARTYSTRAQAEAAAKNVNGVVRERGFTTVSNFNNTVKGPVAIFAPLAKYGDPYVYQLFSFYSGVKRGARFMYTMKNGKVVEKLFETGDIQKAKDLEKMYPEFKTIHSEWIAYNDKLVDFMRDTGVISEQNAATFKMHGDYFPFYRQLEEDADAVGPRIFQSIATVKAPKKLKGGEAALGDFLENIVRNTQSSIQAGIKNIASRRAADVGQDVGIVDKVPPGATPDPVKSFYVLENGLKVFYETKDQLFINAVKSLNLPDLPMIGIFAGPANLLRNLVTKDPGFMLANLMRDSMSAWVTSGVKMTPIADTIANFGKALVGKTPEYEALLNAGIIGGYEFSQNVEVSAREFGGQLRKAAGVPTLTEQIAKPFTSLWEALEKGTTASDAATRMEVYKKTLAETGNEAEAIYRSLEVMNFNRKGSSAVVRLLTAAIPFLNARMQGLDILYRAAIAPSLDKSASDRAKEIQKTFFVRGAMIMGLSAMYWAMTHDDDEYKKQEQETRDNYWLLPSLGIKIPIPFEVGVLFKVIPERILGYTFGDDTGRDFLKSMGRHLISTFAINPIPQTALPLFEAVTNFSFFTWRPVVPQGLEDVAPEYQVGPGTSKIAEMMGKNLGVSPIKIDHLMNGYTGTMGMYAVDLMDAIYNTMTDSPKPSKRFEQMPVIKRFAVDPEARGTVTAYYDLKNSVDEATRTINLLERTMDYEGYGQYMRENMRLLASKDYVLDMEKSLKEIREMKTFIRISKMDADSKRDSLKTLNGMENQLTNNIQSLKKVYQP